MCLPCNRIETIVPLADRGFMFRAPAEAYDRFVGRYSPALAIAMRDAAGVRAGQRALDVGCGSGALAELLAAVLGAENVAAIDPSEPFVEATRARVPGARVVLGSAESLPFADDEFDATLSQLVVRLELQLRLVVVYPADVLLEGFELLRHDLEDSNFH